MQLRSDEHDLTFVSELVKWELWQMVEMENEHAIEVVFESLLDRTQEWKHDQPDRQKRREVNLREEGCDDAFEQTFKHTFTKEISENMNQISIPGAIDEDVTFVIDFDMNDDETFENEVGSPFLSAEWQTGMS